MLRDSATNMPEIKAKKSYVYDEKGPNERILFDRGSIRFSACFTGGQKATLS